MLPKPTRPKKTFLRNCKGVAGNFNMLIPTTDWRRLGVFVLEYSGGDSMSRVFNWLLQREKRVFLWINGRLHHKFLNFILYYITHLGGATLTICITSVLAILAPHPWNRVGLQSLIALGLSHIPVAIIKKLYPRIRPHLAHPQTNTFRKPLVDHSFPSGHSTAIFSMLLPIMIQFPVLTMVLLPLALIVALSRIYLGLHYPSDCFVGAFIGTLFAVITVACWPANFI